MLRVPPTVVRLLGRVTVVRVELSRPGMLRVPPKLVRLEEVARLLAPCMSLPV